ncbi:MAG: hypothetical protein J6J41_05645 [Clostridia bacterium]|jgi:hypothetical protein|nr:hypothetical protein [Clostridia bacterium]
MKNAMRRLGETAVLTAGFMTALMPVAHAYIDPSATTYLVQAIAGIAIAVGSVAVVFWRRAKNKLKEKAGIDFDRNKESEEDVVAVPREDQKP